MPTCCPAISGRSSAASTGFCETGAKKIAFLGFSFKAGTDDLRESPYIELIERLIGKGCAIRIFDKNVELAA